MDVVWRLAQTCEVEACEAYILFVRGGMSDRMRSMIIGKKIDSAHEYMIERFYSMPSSHTCHHHSAVFKARDVIGGVGLHELVHTHLEAADSKAVGVNNKWLPNSSHYYLESINPSYLARADVSSLALMPSTMASRLAILATIMVTLSNRFRGWALPLSART